MKVNKGLYVKYNVFKVADGSVVNDCFVLRPDRDPAAVAALRAYAAATENKGLAADIMRWVGEELPLTLVELRERDGEPVYLEIANGVWGLVETDDQQIALSRNGSIEFDRVIGLAYRTKPERSDT